MSREPPTALLSSHTNTICAWKFSELTSDNIVGLDGEHHVEEPIGVRGTAATRGVFRTVPGPPRAADTHVGAGGCSDDGRLPSAQRLNVAMTLSLRNETQLDDLLRRLYDPTSPDYRKFLTVEQFTAQFGPTEVDYRAVVSFAESHGLAVKAATLKRLVVEASGSVAAIESAFQVNMQVYQHRPMDLKRPSAANAIRSNATGSEGGQFLGSDIRAAYAPGVTLDGSGQSIGLFEFGPYNLSDVQNYFSTTNQPLNVAIINVLLNGVSGSCGWPRTTSPSSWLLLRLASRRSRLRRADIQGIRSPGTEHVRGVGRQRRVYGWRQPRILSGGRSIHHLDRRHGSDQGGVGGTSLAAPRWAGFLALANQQGHGTPIGFLNPTLYALGQGANYHNDLHDVTTGNNFNKSSPGLFSAVAGYDLTTGWGSPNGQSLINALAGSSAAPCTERTR
jgi:hypothetical protein